MFATSGLLGLIAGGFAYSCASYFLKSEEKGDLNEEKVRRVNEALKATNLKISKEDFDQHIIVTHTHITANEEWYKLHIPAGLSFEGLEKKKDVIENVLKSKIRLINDNYQYYLLIKEDPKLRDKYPFEIVPVKNKTELFITVGMTTQGPLNFNISQLPHVLLGATTGAGKSRLLKSILCNLIENYSAKQLELVYLDNKGLECGAFKNVEHLIHRTTNIYDTVSYFNELEHEMMRRNRLIEAKNKTNIVDYNKVVQEADRIPFRFVVIDELFPFLTLPSKQRNEAYSRLGLLLSMSRASGIHFLLSTQRCTSEIIPTLITANCPIALGLRCRNHQESINVIGEGGLEEIDINAVGRGVAVSRKREEFQSFWVTDETIERICSKNTKKRPVTGANKNTTKYKGLIQSALYDAKNDEIEGVL